MEDYGPSGNEMTFTEKFSVVGLGRVKGRRRAGFLLNLLQSHHLCVYEIKKNNVCVRMCVCVCVCVHICNTLIITKLGSLSLSHWRQCVSKATLPNHALQGPGSGIRRKPYQKEA